MGFLRFVGIVVMPIVLVWRAVLALVAAAKALLLFTVLAAVIAWRYKKAYFFLAIFAYAGLNFSAQQPLFLQAAALYAESFELAYNELVVEPYNNIFDCLSPIREWYNLSVAFGQAILARIAQTFGLDLFTFALRDASRAMPPAPPLDVETRALVDECRAEMPKERVISQIIQVICDILDFVGSFLVALLGIFGDFVILVMETVADLFVDDNGDFDFSIPELFMALIFDLLAPLLDPRGCFTPPSNLPWSLAVCLCPHEYDSIADLPSPQWLAPLGCICPINSGDWFEILNSCVGGNVLGTILGGIKTAVGFVQSIEFNTFRRILRAIGFINLIEGIRNRIESVKSFIEGVICSLPAVSCRTEHEVRMEPGPVTIGGVCEMHLFNVSTVHIEGEMNAVITLSSPIRPLFSSRWSDLEPMPAIDLGDVVLPKFDVPEFNTSFRLPEFRAPSLQERVRQFREYTHIGRHSIFGKALVRYLEHWAAKTSPRLSEDEAAQHTFLRHGTRLLGLYFDGLSRLGRGEQPTVHWFMNEFDARGIDVMEFADASIAATRDPASWGRAAQERIARSAIRTRAVLSPDTLEPAVARVLYQTPWLRDAVHQELRAVTMSMRQARAAPPPPPPVAAEMGGRAVIVVGLTIAGLSAVFFSVQIGLLALPLLAPVLAIVLVIIVSFYAQFITVASDILGGILTTILSGGVIRSIDLLFPWTKLFGEFFITGFRRPYTDADIFGVVAQSGELTRVAVEHIALLFIHRFLCTVPRPGITDSCPPKPPFDPNTGLPTMGIAEWIRGLLEADPTGECFQVTDCAGLAKGCRCPDGRLASDEAPCTATGTCETWPYMNGDGRLQPIDLQLDLDVDCEDYGWRFRGVGFWENTRRLEWWLLIHESGLRSLRYVTNSLSVGIDIPWYVLTIGLLGILPIVNLLAKTTVWSTIILNLASFATVSAATWTLAAIAPIGDVFPFDFVREMLVFPNSAGPEDKGSASSPEKVCFWTCFPQFTIFLMLWLTVLLVALAGIAAPLLAAAYGLVRYVLLGWTDFAGELGRLALNAAVQQSVENTKKKDALGTVTAVY